MKIGLVVVARGATDPQGLVERCREATTQEPRWYVAASAPGGQQRAAFARFVLEQPATLWLHPAPPGVSAARNEAVLAAVADGCEVTILIDEGVAFRPNGLDRLIVFTLQQEAAGIVVSEPGGGGCVAIGPAAYHWIAAFDENIAGARLGMADYLLRARAAAIPVETCPDVTQGDGRPEGEGAGGGWAAEAEQAYFIAKWGGLPGATTHKRPFDARASRIDWAQRAAPYGEGHDLRRATPEESEMLVSRPVRTVTETPDTMPTGPAQQAVHRASVRAVYQALLRRDPEEAAYSHHAARLASGAVTLVEICRVVRNSDEHRAILARETE